jgi:selenocysteine lyase/cysteine desulfurase
VPQATIDAMATYLRLSNANHGGAFATSEESDELIAEAHAAAADFLGASPREIVFCQNMTSLTFAFSRALGRTMAAGDEIVVTRLDHDAHDPAKGNRDLDAIVLQRNKAQWLTITL